jgi:1,4-dihydroxy-2-naphthoyl-CoA hydrolase
MFHSSVKPIPIEKVSLEALNTWTVDNMIGWLGIQITEITPQYLRAVMPVNERTKQSFGLLHGGASVVLAETIGSIGANLFVDTKKQSCVGLEINANHIKSVREGVVTGTARPIHVGKTMQVWEILIHDQTNMLVCISRLTMAVIDKPAPEKFQQNI